MEVVHCVKAVVAAAVVVVVGVVDGEVLVVVAVAVVTFILLVGSGHLCPRQTRCSTPSPTRWWKVKRKNFFSLS